MISMSNSILTGPAITLSDHSGVYDAKCGRLQRGVGQMWTGGEGV